MKLEGLTRDRSVKSRSKNTFKIGQNIAKGHEGVFKVVNIEIVDTTFARETCISLQKIHTPQAGKIWVPLSQAKNVGLRTLVTPKQLKEFDNFLAEFEIPAIEWQMSVTVVIEKAKERVFVEGFWGVLRSYLTVREFVKSRDSKTEKLYRFLNYLEDSIAQELSVVRKMDLELAREDFFASCLILDS